MDSTLQGSSQHIKYLKYWTRNIKVLKPEIGIITEARILTAEEQRISGFTIPSLIMQSIIPGALLKTD